MTDRSVDIHVARSKALEQYSALENCLCQLLAALLKADPSLVAHVFYRLGASNRNRTLEELLAARVGKQYDAYLYGTPKNDDTGLIRMIRGLDSRRHQIAHWTVSAFKYPEDQKEKDGVFLVKPEFWASPSAGETMKVSSEDLLEFVERGAFVATSTVWFTRIAASSAYYMPQQRDLDTWLPIFAQPILYPPPPGHPLAPKPQAQPNPPRPSHP